MATSKIKKTGQLESLTEKMKTAAGVAFVEFHAPTVEEVQTVRRACREAGMTYTVIKKTLIAIAAKNGKGVEFSSKNLDGNVAVICSDADEIAPAAMIKKIKADFFDKKSKTSKFDFSGAIFNGEFVDKAGATALGDTPTIEESYGKIIGMLRGGPRGIHSFLQHGTRGIKNALENADKFTKA
jgi:ribosomal protein L10